MKELQTIYNTEKREVKALIKKILRRVEDKEARIPKWDDIGTLRSIKTDLDLILRHLEEWNF